MARLKVFFWYLVIFIIIYVIFDFFTYRYLVNSYKNIKSYEVVASSPEVKINEAKATAVNGYIKGNIKNTTGEDISKTNIKIDLYSKRGNNIGTRYEKIENLKDNQTIEFNLNFKANNVSHIKISFTDENVDEEIKEQAKELQEQANTWLPFINLVTLICLA